jgi:DNA-binding LytR/AlgR family response regulator
MEAARNYVVVGANAREYLIRETLSNLEKTIAPQQIVRAHRSYLINLDFVEEMRTNDSGGYVIRMKSGKHVPLSRTYRESFKNSITA